MNPRLAILLVIGLFFVAFASQGQTIPKGFVVPKCTLSPDGRYGVTVPILAEHDDSENPTNSVIDLKTGRSVAAIKCKFTGWDRMGHGAVLPCRWSPDGSLLLWEVDGKWFHDALVLLKFKDGQLEWQTDLLAEAQKECLLRTKRAAPAQYAKAKKANAGNGDAYPEGFSVEVVVKDQIALPLNFRAALTSDPKEIEGFPKLGSSLTGVVNDTGKIVVKDFHLDLGAFDKLTEDSEIDPNSPDACDFEEQPEK